MPQQRVDIIGGGVAGLAAAIRLARDGVAVRLFEAQPVLGGCCSTATIDGYTFNNGAMYLALPQLLDHAFARLGLERAALLPLRRIAAPQATFLPDGTAVHFGADGVRIDGADGATRTAVLQAQIEHLLARWEPLLRIFADDLLLQPLSLPHVLARTWRHLPKLRGTLADELQRAFSDDDARAAMAAITLYTGLPVQRTPVFQIVGIVSLLRDGLHLPLGGMGAISDVLAATLHALGGEVHTGARVRRIRVDGGRVRGLELDDGTRLDSDAVISTASGMATFAELLDPAQVPAAMRRRVARAPLSHRAVAVQLGLRNRLTPPAHLINHVPLMAEQAQLLRPQPAGSDWLSYSVPTHTLPELAADGGSIVELFAAVDPQRPWQDWDAQRGEAVADAVIATLARHQPLDIAVRRIITPRDYAQQRHLYAGALYGLSPAATPAQQFPHRTPVEGLFLAGQTTYPGFGVATSLLSGAFAADAALARRS